MERSRQKDISDRIDTATGLKDDVLKRFPFSIFGTMDEHRKIDITKRVWKTAEELKVSEIEKLADCHIGNLKEVFEEIISKRTRAIDMASCKDFLEKLFRKYETTPALKNADTILGVVAKVLFSIMDFNNEDKPSDDTKIIVERWLWLQANKVLQSDIDHYIIFDSKMDYIADRERKEKEILKVVKDNVTTLGEGQNVRI